MVTKKLILLFFVLLMLPSKIDANENSGQFIELSEDRLQSIVEKMDLTFVSAEPEQAPIYCFDVADAGNFAVGSRNLKQNQVCVYNSDGVFLYGYTFATEGSYALEIEDGHLNIFLVRSDAIISVDSEGNVIGGAKINDAKESSQYLSKLQSSEKIVNGVTYQADNDGHWPHFLTAKYARLIKVSGNNEQTVLYCVTSRKQLAEMYVLPVAFLCMALVVFFRLRSTLSAKKRKDVGQ